MTARDPPAPDLSRFQIGGRNETGPGGGHVLHRLWQT